MGRRGCGGLGWNSDGATQVPEPSVGGRRQCGRGGSGVSPHPSPLPQAKTKGNKVNVGVKYAEKQERKFEPEKLREGRNIIGLQVPPFPAPFPTRGSRPAAG